MIDLNHKKHQLVLVDELKNEYICQKCDNLIWYQDKDSKQIQETYLMKQYRILDISKKIEYWSIDQGWKLLQDVTCDEIIIKRIIE